MMRDRLRMEEERTQKLERIIREKEQLIANHIKARNKIRFKMLLQQVAKISNCHLQNHFNTLRVSGDRMKVINLKKRVRSLDEELSEKSSVIINLRAEVSDLAGVIGR